MGEGVAEPLPAKAAEVAKKAAEELGVAKGVADDLVRLHAEQRLSGLPVLHPGNPIELVGFGDDGLSEEQRLAVAMVELKRLLHAERCESLQVLACVLRRAQEEGSAGASPCRTLVQKLLSEGLSDTLWTMYKEVSSCPSFGAQPGQAEVLSCVRQGLDMQIGVLECLLLANYNPELGKPSPEQACRMADLFMRQRFLGSLPRVAAAASWVYGDSAICVQAQCVGDLSMLALIQSFSLDDTHRRRPEETHPLLCSVQHVQHLHRLFTGEWIDIGQSALAHRGGSKQAPPEVLHCVHEASLVVLAWASFLAATPQTYRDAQKLGLERLTASAALKSPHLIADAVQEVLRRSFLVKDSAAWQHSVPRAVLSGLVASLARGFQLAEKLPGIHAAASALLGAVHDGQATPSEKFWTSHYALRGGNFYVLQGWLDSFPLGLDGLLSLVGSLAGGPAQVGIQQGQSTPPALYALELLQAPLRDLLLPYKVVEHVAELDNAPRMGGSPDAAQVILKEPVYLEELVLRALGLRLPEWHVQASQVLRAGSFGALLDGPVHAGAGGHRVRWRLEGPGLSVLRVALPAWDAALAALGCAHEGAQAERRGADEAPQKTLLAVVGCICKLILAAPDAAYSAVSQALPKEDGADGTGLLARLLCSAFACAELSSDAALQMLPLLLRSLGACCGVEAPAEGTLPPYALLLQLLGRAGDGVAGHPWLRVRGAGDLARLFAAMVDRERQSGVYTLTLAALDFVASVLEPCSSELLALPWAAHAALPAATGVAAAGSRGRPRRAATNAQAMRILSNEQSNATETLGPLLDFVFCVCFPRCAFWHGRPLGGRSQISQSCIRVAAALLPAVECFNWSLPAALAEADPEAMAAEASAGGEENGREAQARAAAAALRSLRELQLRILRSWSEGSFVTTLLQCIHCDVVYAPSASGGERQFVGFKSPCLQDTMSTHTGLPEASSPWSKPAAAGGGASLLVSALDCLAKLSSIAARPGGTAPLLAPLAAHLIEVTGAREVHPAAHAVQDSNGSAAAPPQRANLAQTLFSLLSSEDSEVTESAAQALASVCELWSSRQRAPRDCWVASAGPAAWQAVAAAGGAVAAAGGSPATPSLLALLATPAALAGFGTPVPTLEDAAAGSPGASPASPPTSRWPDMLSPRLARRLFEVIEDRSGARRAPALRMACLAAARAALASAPGLFLDDGAKLVPEGVAACGAVLGDVLDALEKSSSKLAGDSCGEIMVHALAFLQGVVNLKDSAIESFGQPVQTSGRTFATMWEVLSSIVGDVLRPWARAGCAPWSPRSCPGAERAAPDLFLATATVFRLAARGCLLEGAQASASASLIALLGLLLDSESAELWLPQVSPPDGDEDDVRMDPASDSKRHRGHLALQASVLGDLDLMRHPFGPPPSQAPRRNAEDPATTLCLRSFDLFQGCRTCVDRLQAILARHQLRQDLFAPPSGPHADAAAAGPFADSFLGGSSALPAGLGPWGAVCEVACGGALDGHAAVDDAGRRPLAGTARGTDAHEDARRGRERRSSLRLLVANAGSACSGNPQALQELGTLIIESEKLSRFQSVIAARTVALEAFDDLVHVAARRVHAGKDAQFTSKVQESLTALLQCMLFHLSRTLRHLDLLADHAHFFARLIGFMTHVIAVPPHGVHGASEVMNPFSVATGQVKDVESIKDLFRKETVVGVSLIRQLTAALRICGSRLRHTTRLPPTAAALTAGQDMDSGLSEVALASMTLLMLLVPALKRRPAAEAMTMSTEVAPLLAELLQVLSGLLDCAAAADQNGAGAGSAATDPGSLRALAGAAADAAGSGSAPGLDAWARDAHLGGARAGAWQLQGQMAAGNAVLTDPAASKRRALDHLIGSGFNGLLLALAERVITVLHDREKGVNFEARALSTIQRSLLPRLLSCSSAVFSPQPDLRRLLPSALAAAGAAPGQSRSAAAWDRATEAAWACRLDAVTTVLLAIARSAGGAVMLAEHKVFLLLAHCPLLHATVLPSKRGGQFPAAYEWPTASAPGLGQAPISSNSLPWRRPLHASWCRVLLLAATLLTSAPQLVDEARVFLEVYGPRLRHVFQSGLQTGHLAILEETSIGCRLLALISHRSDIAAQLLTDTAAQTFAFVVGACLTERSSPSEVFLPVAAAERQGAQLSPESEAAPAEVPSIFHQRVEYLALDLLRSMLVALLRIAVSPTWLLAGAPAPSTATPVSPGAWPSSPSVLGLCHGTGASDGGSPQRAWAAVMDAALEGARRVTEIMHSLRDPKLPNLVVVASAAPVGDGGALVPLSLALAALLPESGDADHAESSAGSALLSPGGLARGLQPPSSPRGGPTPFGSPKGGPTARAQRARREGLQRRGTRYQHMALRPLSTVGGQQALGVVPEYVSVGEIRALCGSIVEMSCTLQCHFCQATRSSILAGAERSAPGASVLHGLLSFLHELLAASAQGAGALEPGVVDYLTELDDALRAWQNLGGLAADEKEQPQLGSAWAPGRE